MNKNRGICIGVLLLATTVASLPGCKKDEVKPETTVDRDSVLKSQVTGKWRRDWEGGPVVYLQCIKPDGTVVMEEYCVWDEQARVAGMKPDPDVLHRQYMQKQLYRKQSLPGTWAIKDSRITYRLTLPGGSPMVTVYSLDKITATELVESSEGVSGRQESKYQREKGTMAAPAASATSGR